MIDGDELKFLTVGFFVFFYQYILIISIRVQNSYIQNGDFVNLIRIEHVRAVIVRDIIVLGKQLQTADFLFFCTLVKIAGRYQLVLALTFLSLSLHIAGKGYLVEIVFIQSVGHYLPDGLLAG